MDFSPDDLFARGFELQAQGRHGEALGLFATAAKMRPGDAEGFSLLGSAARLAGDKHAALSAYHTCLSLDPHNAAARHMIAALKGETPARADAGYVQELFDAYAATFDGHARGALGYLTPGHLAAALRTARGQLGLSGQKIGAALDLGCGTGLAAEALKDDVESFYGVDLSPAMMAKARARGLYDALYEADLESFLENPPDGLPDIRLILAADVFPYVGRLTEVFRSVRQMIGTNGFFVFSVEVQHEGAYRLQPSGRFAHSPAYIEHLCRTEGFSLTFMDAAILRHDNDRPVEGLIYVLRRG